MLSIHRIDLSDMSVDDVCVCLPSLGSVTGAQYPESPRTKV